MIIRATNLTQATGEVWARVPNSGGYDVDRAAKAAKTAFPGWAALSYDKRAEFIMKVRCRTRGLPYMTSEVGGGGGPQKADDRNKIS